MDKERPNAASGLIHKRREIAGQVEEAERVLREPVASLTHIEATIRLFDPSADLGKPKKASIAHAAFRGEMARFVLSALRQAEGEPMTTLELARRVMKGRERLQLIADLWFMWKRAPHPVSSKRLRMVAPSEGVLIREDEMQTTLDIPNTLTVDQWCERIRSAWQKGGGLDLRDWAGADRHA
ncbi:hypothetical protein SAMN05519104_4332 [Rhizobiales bacterium GAS188]|nr:hypothetical protein SAMN05519104_4332 [Rhizobiales bacterium GAS188]